VLRFNLDGLQCHVDGPLEERRVLYEKLSIFDPGAKFKPEYRFGAWQGWVRLYDEVEQVFLSGMYQYAKRVLGESGVEVEVLGERLPAHVLPDGFEVPVDLFPGRPLWGHQRSAIQKALYHRGGVIKIPTAGGKTMVAAGMLKILDKPSVFCIHQVNLLRQTAQEFIELGLGGVGMIGDSDWDPNFFTVATIQTLNALLRRGEPRATEFLRSREVMVFDETHHLSAKSWQRVVWAADAPYRYGLSGTPFKEVGLKRFEDFLLLGLCGPVCYSVSSAYLISQGLIARPTIYMVYIGGPEVKGSAQQWAKLYRSAIVEHEARNRRALYYITKFSQLGQRVLVLVKEIRHGVSLLDELQRRGVEAAFLKGGDQVFHQARGEHFDGHLNAEEVLLGQGAQVRLEQDTIVDFQSKTLTDFKEGRIQTLIGSTVLDEGVDVPQVEVLINLSAGKSLQKTLQRLGRSLRRKPGDNRVCVLDFYDRQHGLMRSHSVQRKRQYAQEGHEVLAETELDQLIERLERA